MHSLFDEQTRERRMRKEYFEILYTEKTYIFYKTVEPVMIVKSSSIKNIYVYFTVIDILFGE